MLRAAVLLSFLRRILRFPGLTARTGSTTGRPGALGACYVASWLLPRLHSHQRADDRFQGTSARVRRPSGNSWAPPDHEFCSESGSMAVYSGPHVSTTR
jgi:hypothetical protein